jgi:hypothetical protein
MEIEEQLAALVEDPEFQEIDRRLRRFNLFEGIGAVSGDQPPLGSSMPRREHYERFAVASVERFRRLCAARGIETPLNIQVPTVIDAVRHLAELKKR